VGDCGPGIHLLLGVQVELLLPIIIAAGVSRVVGSFLSDGVYEVIQHKLQTGARLSWADGRWH